MQYGRDRQNWMQCRAISQMVVLVLFGLFVFMYTLSRFYLPYLDAFRVRKESVMHARQYIEVVCGNQHTLKQLGRHGLEDCAKYEKIVLMDVRHEAAIDVLRGLNFCDNGSCMVLSFNAITLLTTFLPMTLTLFVASLILAIGCIGYKFYNAMQRTYEMPISQAVAIAETMYRHQQHTVLGKQQ